MNEKLKQFYQKIHDPKNNIPNYISIIIREPKKELIDFKIKKEPSNILKLIAHDSDQKGWYPHSVHIPLKNLGLDYSAKKKNILNLLSEPSLITSDKATKEYVEDLLRKYIEILPEKKKHFFRTKRFKKKKDMQMGMKMKSF